MRLRSSVCCREEELRLLRTLGIFFNLAEHLHTPKNLNKTLVALEEREQLKGHDMVPFNDLSFIRCVADQAQKRKPATQSFCDLHHLPTSPAQSSAAKLTM